MTRRTEPRALFFLVLLMPLFLALAAVACGRGADARAVDVPTLPVGTVATPIAGEETTPWYDIPARAGTAPTHSYTAAQVERGRRLVAFGSCGDCHTPARPEPETGAPVADMTRFLAGHPEGGPRPGGTLGPGDAALVGPTFTSFKLQFGNVYAMNLTPDIDTGTGSWTEKMFVDIFRKGKHMGGDGRPVLPPMPWPFVATLDDDDLVAIFAYLRSLPPVRNYVPSPEVPLEVMAEIDAANQKMLGRSN